MNKPKDEIQKNDHQKKPPKSPKEELHRSDEALGDASAGGPNATERSRLAE